MRSLVESLKRLYKSGKVSAEKIKGMKILTEEEKRVWLGENRFRLYIDDFGLYFVSDTIRRDYRRTRRNYYGGITCRRIRTLFQSSVDFPEYNAQ